MHELFFLLSFLLLFQVKHYMADYRLQNEYMLRKFELNANEWVPALLLHSFVHGSLTVVISCLFIWIKSLMVTEVMQESYQPDYNLSIWLGLFDMVVHFAVDRWKASPHYAGKYRSLSKKEFIKIKQELSRSTDPMYTKHLLDRINSNREFWLAVGWDQFLHHCTHYIILAILIIYG